MPYRPANFEQKLPLAACRTFHSMNFACIWFPILHARRKRSLKESRVVTMTSFSIELIETIALKCSKKGVLKMLEELTRKHPPQNLT